MRVAMGCPTVRVLVSRANERPTKVDGHQELCAVPRPNELLMEMAPLRLR